MLFLLLKDFFNAPAKGMYITPSNIEYLFENCLKLELGLVSRLFNKNFFSCFCKRILLEHLWNIFDFGNWTALRSSELRERSLIV